MNELMNRLEGVEDRIGLNEIMQENLQNVLDYLDKEWDNLVIEQAKLERDLENASNSEYQ